MGAMWDTAHKTGLSVIRGQRQPTMNRKNKRKKALFQWLVGVKTLLSVDCFLTGGISGSRPIDFLQNSLASTANWCTASRQSRLLLLLSHGRSASLISACG